MAVDEEIRKLIRANSYITLDEAMRIALSAQADSYYISHQPIMQDFITAPEVSQMFGEMVALWCVQQWQEMGKTPFNLIELGPGRGALMHDILRTCKKIAPNFLQAIQEISLVEINPHLKQLQLEKLSGFGIKVSHIANTHEIPLNTSIIIANEFFDALPIKQYRKDQAWEEIVIQEKNDELYFSHIPSDTNFNEHIYAKNGAIIEVCEMAAQYMTDCTKLLQNFGGAMLIVDYGYDLEPKERSNNQYISTLQAMKHHQFHQVLEDLGNADLTAHVDFQVLRQIAAQSGLKTSQAITQRDFLQRLGIEMRARNLIAANPTSIKIIASQLDYLLNKMGQLFKVLEIKNFAF